MLKLKYFSLIQWVKIDIIYKQGGLLSLNCLAITLWLSLLAQLLRPAVRVLRLSFVVALFFYSSFLLIFLLFIHLFTSLCIYYNISFWFLQVFFQKNINFFRNFLEFLLLLKLWIYLYLIKFWLMVFFNKKLLKLPLI